VRIASIVPNILGVRGSDRFPAILGFHRGVGCDLIRKFMKIQWWRRRESGYWQVLRGLE